MICPDRLDWPANQLLGWGVAFVDADEDGWKDILLANGHVYPEVDRAAVGDRYLQRTLLYRNLRKGRFADITTIQGLRSVLCARLAEWRIGGLGWRWSS